MEWIKDIDYKLIKFKHQDDYFTQEKIILPLIECNSSIFYRYKQYSDINDGKTILELHISLEEKLQGKGLVIKVLKAFLDSKNGKNQVFWLSNGRILNDMVYKVIENAKNDDFFQVIEYKDGVTIQKK